MRQSVFLNKLNDKVFIDKLSIAQEERIEERVGYTRFLQAFQMKDPDKDFPLVLKVFWEMLDNKDKDKLIAIELFEYDGFEKKTYKPKDEVDLIKNLVSGQDELTAIALAMMKTIQSSAPDIKENDKKKVNKE